MKKTKMTMNFDFIKCRECEFFPNISTDKYPYYLDKNGVKHRDIQYVCQYDLHEIKSGDVKCARNCNG